MITSYDRGHIIYLDSKNIWRYKDSNDICDHKRACIRCNKEPRRKN